MQLSRLSVTIIIYDKNAIVKFWKNKGDISQEAYDEATIVFKTQNDTFIFKYLEKKMSHPSGAERKTWIDIFGKFAK